MTANPEFRSRVWAPDSEPYSLCARFQHPSTCRCGLATFRGKPP